MIDCHTHWGRLWSERDGKDPSRWLATLDQYGVTHAIVLPEIGLIHGGKVADDNDAIVEVCQKSGGRMIPFCTVNAWYRDEAIAELDRCLNALPFRGVKFHNWLQGFSVAHPTVGEVCEIAAQHDVPILFHDGTPPFCLPSQIALVAKRHPKTKIILGHCGLFEHWREAAEAMHFAPNLWGCICGPPLEAMRYLLQHCDKSRLVWGSDQGFPLADCYPYRLEVMDLLDLSAADRQTIFIDNPRSLLGLE